MKTNAHRPCALVTGGTRGIGRAIVNRLFSEGFDIAFTFRSNPDQAAEVRAQQLALRSAPGQQIEAFQLDLANHGEASTLPQKVVDQLGRLDVLVNNAGLTDDGAFLAMDSERWERLLSSNFGGTAALSLGAIPHLLRGSNPAIVTIASLAGVVGKEGQVAYATTKGALIGLTKLLGRQFGPRGLRVNAIAPGFIRTEMVDGLEPSTFEHILHGTATGRMGDTTEIAEAVSFLLRPSYLQGTTLRADGGFMR